MEDIEIVNKPSTKSTEENEVDNKQVAELTFSFSLNVNSYFYCFKDYDKMT